METENTTKTAADSAAQMVQQLQNAGVPMDVVKAAGAIFLALIFFYFVLVLFKTRIVGSHGEHLRVVDQIAVTQTSRVALLELAGSELYLIGINDDRIFPVATVSNETVLRKVLHRTGNPQVGSS